MADLSENSAENPGDNPAAKSAEDKPSARGGVSQSGGAGSNFNPASAHDSSHPGSEDPASDGSSDGASGGAKYFGRDAASNMGIGKSHSLFTLIVVSVAAGSLVVAYVLFVGWYIIRKNQSDTIKLAAIQAARDLSDIIVQSPSTGPLSLCNWRSGSSIFAEKGEHSPRTVASWKSTCTKIRQVAEMTHLQMLSRLVAEDEKAILQEEKELRRRLDESIVANNVTPALVQESSGTALSGANQTVYGAVSGDRNHAPPALGRIWQRVKGMILRRYALNYGLSSMSLVSVKIRLGHADHLPEPGRPATIFLVDSSFFQEAPPGTAPNLVLVESVFKLPVRPNTPPTYVEKRECAAIKPPVEERPAAAFVLTFPQGVPPIRSNSPQAGTNILSILKFSNWGTSGLWHQAVGGDVPGNGRLAPPLFPALPEMTPGDALAVELYHWLKYAGEGIDPSAVSQMLLEPWSEREKKLSGGDFLSFGVSDEQINSCLVNDTGSRENAVIYESNKGEVGQRALAKALNIRLSQQIYVRGERPAVPQSAFPFFINKDGQCRLIARNDFDENMLRDFLNGLYRTNLAANESIASLKTLQQVTYRNVQTLEQKLSMQHQELLSLNRESQQSRYADDKSSNAKLASQKRFLQERIDDLKIGLQQNQDQLNQNQRMLRLMDRGLNNASRAARGTFELCAHKYRYCRDGMIPYQGGFLIGKNLAFKPLEKTVSVSDIYDSLGAVEDPTPLDSEKSAIGEHSQDNSAGADRTEKVRAVGWLAGGLDVVGPAQRVFPNLNPQVSSVPAASHFQPRMLVVDSRDIQEGRHQKYLPFVQIFSQYPFGNIPLPQSELVYYSQDALVTGKKPDVTWSVLARDFLANGGHQVEGHAMPGFPIRAQNNSWCQESMFGTSSCPGLACEFQIRSPLPKVGALVENAYLLNVENGERSPLIPPVTPDML